MSMYASYSHGRVSRLASSCPKDFNFEFFVYQNEANYPNAYNKKLFLKRFFELPDGTLWNSIICVLSIVGLLIAITRPTNMFAIAIDAMYNILYLLHVVAMVFDYLAMDDYMPKCFKRFGFVLDFISYLHYIGMFLPVSLNIVYIEMKIFCYVIRLHRPFEYFWTLSTYNLKGSVLGTALRYTYIFIVARIICVIVWIHLQPDYFDDFTSTKSLIADKNKTQELIVISYLIDVLFLPIGMSTPPHGDTERVKMIVIMMIGRLLVTGSAVASLSLVISIYMRPEEAFRARFRLIMKDMKDSNVPVELRNKVETFYRMYWQKQSAVSVTKLLPIFPHTIPISIYTDIYFEAQQKSLVLRDLSYQFLWEVAKTMSTIHYIPGDAIIQQHINKSSIIYIAFGDVEMITAEDNITPILRMTRGTILNPCGCCAKIAGVNAVVDIRAATFCTAHVLKASDLWRVAVKYGRQNGQVFIVASSLEEHLENVKAHFKSAERPVVQYKSSIKHFKQNLIELKEGKDASGNYLISRNDYFLEIAGCYLMRNQTDTALTDEADEICLRPTFPYILQPQSSLLVFWHAFVSLLICIVCFTHPYTLVFKMNASHVFRFYDGCMTVVFILDLLVHLSTGTNVEEGVPITFGQTSSQQVQSAWFVVDVLATLPIFEFVADRKFAGINKLLRLPKVFRVLKQMEEVCVYQSNILRFGSYTLLIFFACYLVATMLQAFLCFYIGYCNVVTLIEKPFWGKSTDNQTSTDTSTNLWFALYIAASMVTFTSDTLQMWHIDDQYTVLYRVILLEIIMILNIFIEAVYSATIMVTTAMRCDYDTMIENVKNFLIINNMDPMLRHRFIMYLQLCWYTDKAYSITHEKLSIFFDLPPHVYTDMVAVQRSKYLLCLPFMTYVHQGQVKELASNVRLFYTSPNEILLNTGDISNEIYVIKQGICEVFDPDTKKSAGLISEKKYFGVLECIFRVPAFYTVRAVTHVQVYSISRKYLKKIIELPRLKDAVDHCKSHAEYRRLRRHREPFLWYEMPPPSPNWTKFPLPRKHIGDHVYMQPFQRLGVLSMVRYVTPRVTIRPDGMYIARYEWFRALCSLVSALIFPGYIYMVYHFTSLYYVKWFLDITAYIDIVQRMLVGYYNEKGILVSHPASAAAHYITGAFLMDLLGCLPFEDFEDIRSLDKDTIHLMSTAQFLMLNRLLQLYRLPGAMDHLKLYIDRRDYILIIKSIPLFLAVINVFTCAVVFYSVDMFVVGHSPNVTFRITPLADANGSWINKFNYHLRYNIVENPLNLHLTAYFWVVYETTSTGYGIFLPSNVDLVQIMLFAIFVSAMITTYFTVSIISIRANVSKELASFQEHMKDMILFMKREKLDHNLQRRILSYYEYNWEKLHGLDYRIVLKLCDQITLRTDAILHIYGHTFNKCPILFHCDLSLLRVLGRAVRSVYFIQNTTIIEMDDVISNIYIVDYGQVEISDMQGTCVKLSKGSLFGNLNPQMTIRCPNTTTTISSTHLLQINSLSFHKIIQDFPTVSVLMKKYRPRKELYIMGSQDSSDNKEKERSISNAFIKPLKKSYSKRFFSQVKLAENFTVLICLVCIYADIFNAGFNDNSYWLIIMLYVLDGLFYFRMLFTFLLPLIVRGEMKLGLTDHRKRYIREEFKYDVLSILPLELFCLVQQHDPKAMWRMFSLLRLNRTFRGVTVDKCINRHKARLSSNLVITTVMAVSIWFTLFIHTTSCLWYALGMWEDGIKANSSWLHPIRSSRRAGVSLKKGANGTRTGELCGNHYICASYFVITTFVQNGVGDILPRQRIEIVFVSILQIVSTLMYMAYVGEFSNIIQYQSFRSFDFFCKYLELQEFLKNNRVSKNLMTLVNEYSLHLWRESRGHQVPQFLDNAPENFKLSIMSAAYIHHLKGHPAFEQCEPAFLRQLAGCLKPFTYSKNLFVVKDSEITDSMYIIHRGKVQELDEDMDVLTHGHVFHEGENFGMMQGLVRNTPFTYSYRTMTKCQVLSLVLDDWEYLLQHFPNSRYSIYKNISGHPHNRPPEEEPEEEPHKPPPPRSGDTQEEEEDIPKKAGRRATIFKQPQQSTVDLAGAKSEAAINAQSVRDLTAKSDYGLPYAELSMVEKPSGISMGTLKAVDDMLGYPEDMHEEDETASKPLVQGHSIMSMESDMDITRRETLQQRRKTFFQKVSEGAKKLVGAPDRRDTVGMVAGEGMDSLLLQEEMAMTAALANELDESPQSDEKRNQQLQRQLKGVDQLDDRREKRGVRMFGEEFPEEIPEDDYEEKTAEEQEYIARRASRLSFLPGLVAPGHEGQESDPTKTDTGNLKSLIGRRQSVATLPKKEEQEEQEKALAPVKPSPQVPLTIRDDDAATKKSRRLEDIKRKKGTFYETSDTAMSAQSMQEKPKTAEKQTETFEQKKSRLHRQSEVNTEFYMPVTVPAATQVPETVEKTIQEIPEKQIPEIPEKKIPEIPEKKIPEIPQKVVPEISERKGITLSEDIPDKPDKRPSTASELEELIDIKARMSRRMTRIQLGEPDDEDLEAGEDEPVELTLEEMEMKENIGKPGAPKTKEEIEQEKAKETKKFFYSDEGDDSDINFITLETFGPPTVVTGIPPETKQPEETPSVKSMPGARADKKLSSENEDEFFDAQPRPGPDVEKRKELAQEEEEKRSPFGESKAGPSRGSDLQVVKPAESIAVSEKPISKAPGDAIVREKAKETKKFIHSDEGDDSDINLITLETFGPPTVVTGIPPETTQPEETPSVKSMPGARADKKLLSENEEEFFDARPGPDVEKRKELAQEEEEKRSPFGESEAGPSRRSDLQVVQPAESIAVSEKTISKAPGDAIVREGSNLTMVSAIPSLYIENQASFEGFLLDESTKGRSVSRLFIHGKKEVPQWKPPEIDDEPPPNLERTMTRVRIDKDLRDEEEEERRVLATKKQETPMSQLELSERRFDTDIDIKELSGRDKSYMMMDSDMNPKAGTKPKFQAEFGKSTPSKKDKEEDKDKGRSKKEGDGSPQC